MTELARERFGTDERVLLYELNHRINNEFAAAISLLSLAATRSHDENVIAVVYEFVGAHVAPPKATFSIANTPATATSACAKVNITSVRVFIPLLCT